MERTNELPIIDVEQLTPEQAVDIATRIAVKFGPIIFQTAEAFPQRSTPHHVREQTIEGGEIILSPSTGTQIPRYFFYGTPGLASQLFYRTNEYPAAMAAAFTRSQEKFFGDALKGFEKSLVEALKAVETRLDPHSEPATGQGEREEEGTEADWLAVKEEVLRLLRAEALDTPAAHLAYIRNRIKPVFDHVEP